MRDLACGLRVVVENRAFAIVLKATAARRAVSALQMVFQNRSTNNTRWRREEKFFSFGVRSCM